MPVEPSREWIHVPGVAVASIKSWIIVLHIKVAVVDGEFLEDPSGPSNAATLKGITIDRVHPLAGASSESTSQGCCASFGVLTKMTTKQVAEATKLSVAKEQCALMYEACLRGGDSLP